MLNFKRCLETDGQSDLGPSIETAAIGPRALSEIENINTVKALANSKSAKVRKYFEQTSKIMLSRKDFITGIAATNPYAAAAWTGVCFILSICELNFLCRLSIAILLKNTLLNWYSCFWGPVKRTTQQLRI